MNPSFFFVCLRCDNTLYHASYTSTSSRFSDATCHFPPSTLPYQVARRLSDTGPVATGNSAGSELCLRKPFVLCAGKTPSRQALSMCRVFTFHHFCGHVHSTHTLPCPSPTAFTSSPPACHSPSNPDSDSKVLSPSPSCADTTQEPHLYPTLCATCKEIGIISDWFACEPSKRFEAIMEWRKLDGRESGRKRTWSTPDAGEAARDTENCAKDASEVLEEMPFIQLSDLQSSSSEEGSRSDSSTSTATTVIHALSRPSPTSSSPPPITITAASPPSIPLPVSPKGADNAHPEDHQAAIQVNSSASATTPDPSPFVHVASAGPVEAAAATNKDESPTTTTTTAAANNTATDAKLSTTIHQTQALVARMAALNKAMQNRSRLPLPSSSSTSASTSTTTTHKPEAEAEAKAKAKASPTPEKPHRRLPPPRPVGVANAMAMAETGADAEAEAGAQSLAGMELGGTAQKAEAKTEARTKPRAVQAEMTARRGAISLASGVCR
jgi:hypothetical protein